MEIDNQAAALLGQEHRRLRRKVFDRSDSRSSPSGLSLMLRKAAARVRAYRRTTTVTVAVAGLSRSGKTAFITSTVANLIAAQSGVEPMRLRGFSVVDDGRLRGAVIPPVYTARQGKRFPYAEMMKALTAEKPEWPRRTE